MPSLRHPQLIDANLVAGTMFMGAFEPPRRGLREHIDAIVLCALERQPPTLAYTGIKVMHCPLLDDLTPLTIDEFYMVQKMIKRLRTLLDEGAVVLVSCYMGLNRSGFISAAALMTPPNIANRLLTVGTTPGCMHAAEAIRLVRMSRGTMALSNPKFTYILAAGEHPCSFSRANRARVMA